MTTDGSLNAVHESMIRPWREGTHPDVRTATEVQRANTDAQGAGKQSNPKDAIGSTKLALGLVPDTLVVAAAMAFTEGATKYGRFNWRVAGVRASIYHDALRRHLAKWWNGEECDPQTGVPHLASVAACVAILLDAAALGKLTDDRPPAAPLGAEIATAEGVARRVREIFSAHDPKQWTIADGATGVKRTPRLDGSGL